MSEDALGLLDLDEDPPTPQILLPPTHKTPANAVDLFDELTGQQTQITRRPWMEQKQFILGTVDNLDLIMNLCIASGRYGIDLETSGLDNRVFPDGERLVTQDKIAGICLSPDGITGYYIPLNHYKIELNGTRTARACNIPMSVFDPAFRRLLTSTEAGKTIATFFHAKFDQEFLQFNGQEPWGTWEAVKTWDCMMLMAYLRDSRARSRGLKKLAKELLGIEMVELEELFPKDYRGDKNFSLLDPTDPEVLIYAGGDAICTVLLYPVLAPAVLEPASDERTQKGVYKIEKGCVTATRWMERNRIHLDMNKVWELTVLGQKEWFASVMEVYQGASEILGRDVMPGAYKALRDNFKADDRNQLVSQQVERAEVIAPSQYPNPVSPIMREKEAFPPVYDLSSPQQLGRMFQEMNVPGLKFTEKSGQVKTSKDELDRVVEEAGETFPFMQKIKKFRETGKALSSYLYPMLLDSEPTDDTMRINFRQDGTDTGRYATPSRDSERGKLKGFPQINLQGLPATYDTKRPECMLRLRECITPRPTPAGTPPKYLVSADYSGEELRLATNLSGEPKWVAEFFHCADCDRTFDRGDGQTTPEAPPRRCPNCGSDKIGDLHTLTGLEVYGREAIKAADWKKKRDSAKKANFALSYGGGPSAVQRSTGCDQNEAHRIKRQFDATYRGLKAWWLNQHAFARKHKFVRTAFNRMYPVPDIDNADGGFRSKAERNAVNGPIQGCLHPDSRIPTSLGLLSVKELWDRQEAGNGGFRVWTGRTWQAGRARFSGEKQLCQTTLESGRHLRTSPDHLFRTWAAQGGQHSECFEWLRQEDLTPNTWVATNRCSIEYPEPSYMWQTARTPQDGHLFSSGMTPHNTKRFSLQGNSEVLWEFLGLIYGDGSIHTNDFVLHVGPNLALGFDPETWTHTYADKLNSALPSLEATVGKKERPPDETHRQPLWQIRVYNKGFRDFCRQVLGVEDQNTYTKRFPRTLWSESQQNRAAFLRGYFSADGSVSATGDTVSVRSVNQGLLEDAQALLNSIGIRASWTASCLRVTVLDRIAFRAKVGFLIQYKNDRLAQVREDGYCLNHWHLLPPDIIRWVGQTVYASSIYAALPRAQKSAVLRLVVGSGSRPQCLRYLDQVPTLEVPSLLREVLEYDYERVTGTEDMGKTVTMYDIEIFDEDHAFVCDGAVVHNSGGDMIKLAMAMIHKECKARGWLTKILLVACMHDELVFEIDADILEEALPVIVGHMTRNKLILERNWPIPFVSDVEIGPNWTVPWDLNSMVAREARFIGDKKYKDKSKLPDGADWDSLPSWPDSLRPWFPVAQGVPTPSDGGKSPTTPSSSNSPTGSTPPILGVGSAAKPESTPIPPSLKMGPPNTPPGGVYEFRIGVPLVPSLLHVLAELIHKCRGQGTKTLRLVAPSGEMLEGWDSDSPVLVDDQAFYYLARDRGLF